MKAHKNKTSILPANYTFVRRLKGWIGLIVLFICLCAEAPAQPLTDTLFQFAHVSDTHVGDPTGVADLQATVNDINKLTRIEFVVISGDITQMGSDEELATAKTELDKLNKPWYIVPGNHDTKWSESGTTTFKRIFGRETFSFTHKGFLFIGTGSGPNMRMGPGQVQREDLNMIDSVIKMTDKATPVIFVNHYPLNNTMNNWYEVLDRMKESNLKAILCGHGHANQALNFEGIPGIMGRSNLRDKSPAGGYNMVTVTTDSLVYSERRPGESTRAPWHSIRLSRGTFPEWDKNPPRPDYSMNRQFTQVKEKWSIAEKADIGGGIGVYQNAIVYATTAGEIKAVEVNSGRTIWKYDIEGKIYSTPLILRSYVIVPVTNGNVYCIDARTGKQKWSYRSSKPYVSSAAAYKDVVVVAGSDGYCRAIRIDSGKVIWEYGKISHFVETKPLIDGDAVYFGSWGNEFYCLDARTGELNWKWVNNSPNRLFSSAACWPVIAREKLFMVAPDRHMTSFNKLNGNIVWRVHDTLNRVRESIGISQDKEKIYVKTMQGKILAINSSSHERTVTWAAPVDLGPDLCPSPIVERHNTVFVPTESGVVYALDNKKGDLLWKHKFSNCLVNAIQPINEHTIIATSMDGKVTCITF